MESYLQDKADKPSIAKMKDAWKPLRRHFGHLRPDQVTRSTSRLYWNARAGRSNGTIIKELTLLRAALNWHDKNTPAVVVTPPTPAPRDRFITKREYRSLFYKAQAHHMKVFLALAWYTAARKEAILALTWDRVNLETRRINFGPDVGKKGRAQITPIGRALWRVLTLAKRAAVSNSVVAYGGKRVLNIKKGFAAAADRAGLKAVTPHDIRRSSARHMVEKGISMSVVSQLLGHKSEEVTARVYARFSPGFLMSAINAL
jgi:integrase